MSDVTLVKLQDSNASNSIAATLEGMVMLVISQPWNALSPITVTPLGIIVFLQPFTSKPVAVSMIALQFSRLS